MKTAAVHRFADNPDAPGTCSVCHLPDRADEPRNRHHDPEAVAEQEAAQAWAHKEHRRRYGTD